MLHLSSRCLLLTLVICTHDRAAAQDALPLSIGTFPQEVRSVYDSGSGLRSDDVRDVYIDSSGSIFAQTSEGWSRRDGERWMDCPQPSPSAVAQDLSRHQRPLADNAPLDASLLPWSDRVPAELGGEFPSDGQQAWLVRNACVVQDGLNRYWFATEQGVACHDGAGWHFYTAREGLPYNRFTCAAGGQDGSVWFGTDRGVVRFDGHAWAYRQGKRWLPSDEVRAIAVDAQGGAWIATSAGLSHIHFRPLTFAEKAEFYESEIDQYNRRTEFGYVIQAHTQRPGDKTDTRRSDSDNDGLWTSMYGASQCFAYAATRAPQAQQRAKQAFEAMRFLSIAPRGGSHPAPSGFIARTILETSHPDPNQRPEYTLEGQRRAKQTSDALWRIYEPRWPTTADGRYYWKSDTSSDELDGHYFFYALYYDLVAETQEEKERVRELVRDNADHLLAHDYSMHDHAGLTRWAVFTPKLFNQQPWWAAGRGLNSLSILSYLATAAHITGDQKYLRAAAQLRDEHGYHQNLMVPKIQAGIGTGNQSDDEMAFMLFYNLIRYEPDAELRQHYLFAFWKYWQLEQPELNPFFNFCYAACGQGQSYTNQWESYDLSPASEWLTDSADTLRRYPLDRFDWAHDNSHRIDLIELGGFAFDDRGPLGYRTNGKVVPVDESFSAHLNHSPWRLQSGGQGQVLGDGTVFLLPYYMGLYHGFIE